MSSFTRPKKVIGIDLGAHSVKALQVSKQGRKIYIEEAGYAPIDNELAVADPIKASTDALLTALAGFAIKQSLVVTALPGNTAVVRYPKITLKTNESLANAVEREAGQYIPFDLNEVYLSWDVIAQEANEPKVQVLLVAAKNEAINNKLRIFQSCDIQCSIFDIDSIAIFNALERCGLLKTEESTAIFDIGYSSSSIHFVRDMKSIFIRDLMWGSKDILDAIVKEKRCDYSQAEKELISSSKEIETGHPEAVEIVEPEPEEVVEAIEAEETVSPLEPLDEELAFDQPTPETVTFAPKSMREIMASPMNRMVSEVRRSFDFFEHQLYEKPVERIILCGGASSYPLIGETLVNELNVETVEVADLITSEVLLSHSKSLEIFKENTAKFTTAFGLSVRGLAEI